MNSNKAGEQEYIFHMGTESEIRLKWKQEEDGLPRQNPPFMLEGDILSYVTEIESILSVTEGTNLDISEKRYRGLNNVLARMLKENEGYVWELEVKCSEGKDYVIDECGRILTEGGIESSSCNTFEDLLPPIKNLVECKYGYTMVYGEVFHVSEWWLKEGKFDLYPGVVVLYLLWRILDKTVEETHQLFEKIGHKVEDVTPAYAANRMKERIKNGEKIMQSELNHPIYTVTGIRFRMGDNLSGDERTAAAEHFLAGLKRGQRVMLMADKNNPFDPKAIAAYINYNHIGYIARENTDEVSALLDNAGQCDAEVERTDGHVTLFISIPGATEEFIVKTERLRQLPISPLGEGVRMPYTDDEKTLQLVATRLIKTEVSTKNLNEIINMAVLYEPLTKLSICYDDTLWRDKISKKLYRILYGSPLPLLLLKEEERKVVENLYASVSRAIGDMRSTEEHWPERIFVEHLKRLRDNESINKHLYKKYCEEFLDGKDFADADKTMVAKEYERLCGWLKKMEWRELRNPDDWQKMGVKVNNLGLSRQELYDLYSVLLIIEKLRNVIATTGNKLDNKCYFSPNKYDSLSDSRKAIADGLFALIEKGDWVDGITADDIKGMLTAVLGMGETPLSNEEEEMSEALWDMFEHGRGDRVKIVCANLVGYFSNKKLFVNNNPPILSAQFFGNKKSIDNINKGRYDRLSKVIPLLDAHVPKVVKKR